MKDSLIIPRIVMFLILNVIAFWGTYATFYWKNPVGDDYIIFFYVVILFYPVLAGFFEANEVYQYKSVYTAINSMFLIVAQISALSVIVFLLKLSVDRKFFFMFILVDSIIRNLFLYMVYLWAKRHKKKSKNNINIYIVGNKTAIPLIYSIKRNVFLNYSIKGIFSNDQGLIGRYKDVYPVSPEISVEEFKQKLIQEPIDEVFYCNSHVNSRQLSDLVYLCLELGVTFRVSSDFLSLSNAKAKIHRIGELPYFTFQNTPANRLQLLKKTFFDKMFSALILTLLLPLFLIIAVCIKIDSQGPVFFKQRRVGIRGREFTMYKFRSMCKGAEQMLDEIKDQNEQNGPVFKVKNDARITRFGKFLRKTSLDELPQFFNVLKGDMSVVGPRPALPEEVAEYKSWQLRRLSVSPGITCLWQVSGRNNIPFEQWMKLDLWYIDTWTLELDLVIILKTIKTILKHDGQ